MVVDLVRQLVEALDKKCYAAVIHYVAQHNKRMSISGFSSLEKTPLGLILNTLRTNKNFRDALLDACVAVILDGDTVDFDKSLQENKEAIVRERWLGVAAAYLKNDNDQNTDEIARIISEHKVKVDEPVKVDTKVNGKQEKREEKFREKYLKAHAEVERMSALIAAHKADFESTLAENDELKKTVEGLSAEKKTLLQMVSDKDKEIQQLRGALAESKEDSDKKQGICVKAQKNITHILAPNCKDILEKYVEKLKVEFDDIAEKTKEELLQQYDQIWVFPNAISFATSRKLSKWKKEDEEKIVWFSSAAELLAKAEEMI